MSAAEEHSTYVLTIGAVRWALDDLRSRRIHPFFLAYLFLHKWAVEQGSESDIQPKWDELGEFLLVKGSPPGKPYYRPFWPAATAGDPGRYWLNPNIAGSYAPSSLRQVPYKVIDTEGSHFSLKSGHAALALEHLLFGDRISAVALAAYLCRDFGFTAGANGDLQGAALIGVLRQDFHYRAGDPDFDVLFSSDLPAESEPWFQPLTGDTLGVE